MVADFRPFVTVNIDISSFAGAKVSKSAEVTKYSVLTITDLARRDA